MEEQLQVLVLYQSDTQAQNVAAPIHGNVAVLLYMGIAEWAGHPSGFSTLSVPKMLGMDSGELSVKKALQMLEEIYAKNFWTEKERFERLPAEPFELPGPFFTGTTEGASAAKPVDADKLSTLPAQTTDYYNELKPAEKVYIDMLSRDTLLARNARAIDLKTLKNILAGVRLGKITVNELSNALKMDIGLAGAIAIKAKTALMMAAPDDSLENSMKRTPAGYIGRFENVKEAWTKIVNLYGMGKVRWIAHVLRDSYEHNLTESQYVFVPESGDVVVPGEAYPIDYDGPGFVGVNDRIMHKALRNIEGPVELIVDNVESGVAKIVPVSASVSAKSVKAVEDPAISMARISKDLPVRAKEFAFNLMQVLAKNLDQIFFIGIETDIGESQEAQIMPLRKAVDAIQEMKDAAGKSLFPNLIVKRAKAAELASTVVEMNTMEAAKDEVKSGKLDLSRVFIAARKTSVESGAFNAIEGEGRAWISAIDDSASGDYIPVFEAITLNMMAYLGADMPVIKEFYERISNGPIDIETLKKMLTNRIIYILPRVTKIEGEQLRKLYELARQAYIAA